MNSTDLHFYHAPNTRSAGVRILLEELEAPYTLHPLNLALGEQRKPEYLAINPMGKVPAIVHNGALVTEQSAIYTYLADAFPDKGLAPAIGNTLRGPYLRWMAFYGNCYEPAIVDKALQRDAGRSGMSPYGDYATMFSTLNNQLAVNDFIAGDRFTAADVLWATALGWTTQYKLVEETPEIKAYMARISVRPAVARATTLDAELSQKQAEEAKNAAA